MIIGLIIGAVLVGQDLIRAAYIRAQISQIEKFNTAVNTFYGKYQALPGDMSNGVANTYGFSAAVHNAPNPAGAGFGDGNGIIDGGGAGEPGIPVGGFPGQFSTYSAAFGETAVFWGDLSSATAGNLIEGGFNLAAETTTVYPSGTQISQYLPVAKLGSGNYVYVTEINGINYFGIENVTGFFNSFGIEGVAGMTVAQAYNIDKKVDDGLPTTGRVAAMVSYVIPPSWVLGGPAASFDTYVPSGSLFSGTVGTAGNASGSTTCFDAATGTEPTYSMEQNNGAGLNCALIMRMQGGD